MSDVLIVLTKILIITTLIGYTLGLVGLINLLTTGHVSKEDMHRYIGTWMYWPILLVVLLMKTVYRATVAIIKELPKF